MKLKTLSLIVFLLFSCGEPSHSNLNEAITTANDPLRIPGAGNTLEYSFGNLPEHGFVDRLWTGWWWPMSEGGTASRRFGISPMKKYDWAVESDTESWELRDSRRFAHIAWAGHCNGIVAAGIMHEEPRKSVHYRGVTFRPWDIKALLAEMWQGSGWIIGEKCARKNPKRDQHGRIKEQECRDINPGTFHLAITNYLGLFGKSLILDMDNSNQVWNYAISEYRIFNVQWMTRTEAAAAMHDDGTPYTYNADATDLVLIGMSLRYVGMNNPVAYEYLLELNMKGEILGGEWYGESKSNHPDFLWRPKDSKANNPHLDKDIIMDIYLDSL